MRRQTFAGWLVRRPPAHEGLRLKIPQLKEVLMDRPGQSRSRAARSRSKTPKKRPEWVTVLCFYVLPFILVNGILFILVAARPHITIYAEGTSDYKTTTVSVTVRSLLPITEFTSSQEGAALELTQTGRGEYETEITQNGVIEIYVKSLNGMTARQYEHINILDDTAPLVGETYSIENNILTLTLEDSQSGLDFSSVYASADDGTIIQPASSDTQTGTFTFEMAAQTLYIHASDLVGNTMQATFSTHTETADPNSETDADSESSSDAQDEAENSSDAQDEAENSQDAASIYIDTDTP